VADVNASHGVQHHQFADDTQLRLAMAADNMAGVLSILTAAPVKLRPYGTI